MRVQTARLGDVSRFMYASMNTVYVDGLDDGFSRLFYVRVMFIWGLLTCAHLPVVDAENGGGVCFRGSGVVTYAETQTRLECWTHC